MLSYGCRPVCSHIGDESACNTSVDCYWTDSACERISAAFCETDFAQSSIRNCRKDGNDFCYYNDGQCKVCNENGTTGDYNLITMEGMSCIPQSVTCAPYFEQPGRAGCRKYCEPIQVSNTLSYMCDFCPENYAVFND